MNPVEIVQGQSAVVLGMPHTGTYIPADILEDLNETGRALTDTDWHIHKLYEGLLPGATTVRARFHRYVIDANRDPSGDSLYPGQNTTDLVPLTDFDGRPIWRKKPSTDHVKQRREAFHAIYHAALETELLRVRELHGVAILFDCHSIRSRIPYLFDGILPDFNIGTNMGVTCAPSIAETVENICLAEKDFTCVTNGRFKGGWTTRHYGRQAAHIHAIQMELAQSTYMQEAPPWTYSKDRATAIRKPLRTILGNLNDLAREGVLNDKPTP